MKKKKKIIAMTLAAAISLVTVFGSGNYSKAVSVKKAEKSPVRALKKQISKQLIIKLMHISVLMISRSFLSYMSLKFLVRIMKKLSYLSMKAHQHLW